MLNKRYDDSKFVFSALTIVYCNSGCCKTLGAFSAVLWLSAPVAQVDRAPASGAGCERSSRSRGVFLKVAEKLEGLFSN